MFTGRWGRRDKPASLKRAYREPKRQERRRAREEIESSLEELEIEREETAKEEARVLDYSHPELTDPQWYLHGTGDWGPLYLPVEDCDGYEDDSHPGLTDPPDDYELTGYGWE